MVGRFRRKRRPASARTEHAVVRALGEHAIVRALGEHAIARALGERALPFPITEPEAVIQSDPTRHATGVEYYGAGPVAGWRVKVCVEDAVIEGETKRVVKTVMRCRRLGDGAQLWP